MNYLNDFLHMMYKPFVEGELQVTEISNERWMAVQVVENTNYEFVCMMQLYT